LPAVSTIDDLDLLRRRVVNVIGHELRTPVTTVRGLAESLVDAPDDGARVALTTALVRSAIRLERLVDDLLLASGIFTASPVGDAVEVDVADAVRRAGWAAPIEGAATLTARTESVDRILEPIIDNARRHGEPLEARISATATGVVVDIESTGPELGEGDVQLLCEPFFRGEAAVMTAPGLGLGLAIARTIARAEGGDVHAHARAEGGLVVRVELAHVPLPSDG
jgi:two-component system, OmpR family, phosphate regulon sensor histidine kinase PhoR